VHLHSGCTGSMWKGPLHDGDPFLLGGLLRGREFIQSKIVLLHGFGHVSNSLNLRQFLEDMSGSYQILAFDLLGHGRSSDPTSPVGFEEHARIMHQAATELGYERYSLIGYSFGGWISMRTAAIYSDYIEKLVIVDVTPITYRKPKRVPIPIFVPKKFKDTESAVKWLTKRYPRYNGGSWYDDYENALIKKDGVWHMASHPSRKKQLYEDGDGWSFIKQIKVPCLLFRGSNSQYATQKEVARMEESMEDLIVITIEGANHMVVHTHLEEFEKAIQDFIPC